MDRQLVCTALQARPAPRINRRAANRQGSGAPPLCRGQLHNLPISGARMSAGRCAGRRNQWTPAIQLPGPKDSEPGPEPRPSQGLPAPVQPAPAPATTTLPMQKASALQPGDPGAGELTVLAGPCGLLAPEPARLRSDQSARFAPAGVRLGALYSGKPAPGVPLPPPGVPLPAPGVPDLEPRPPRPISGTGRPLRSNSWRRALKCC